ncbi:hypothetical protein EXIGLDRAFT_58200 [Exidia glandulosa HHB12029]|uniref:LysM domain-containing protein n=1 Tax=Exidia glandulosa HHB12029 TaxID=1314781 RepID=A0A165I6C6_EXIGL|nr:hypothetical protein EXIGLDRAFT_58200 [Exidia glandulosa HHB12029]
MVSFALKIVTAIVSTIGVAIMIWQMVNMLHKSTPSSGGGGSSGGDSSGGDSSGGKSSGDQFGGCSQSYTAVAGDSCTSIAQNFGISVPHFLSLNPSVSVDCRNLHIGTAYCLESSGTDSSGGDSSGDDPSGADSSGDESPGCSHSYTAVAGDTCNLIARNFGVSVDQFLSLNPSVSPDCTNLHIGTAYCV